jgi:hypothetical protein
VYWYGSFKGTDGNLSHNRKSEKLDQYLYTDPKTKIERQHNKETLQLVEAIRAKRITEAAQGQHGFTDTARAGINFYAFWRQVMETKKTPTSSANYKLWQACLVQLKRHHPDESLTFDKVNADWVNGVQKFFDTRAKTKSGNLIRKATASGYFNKVRAVINAAYAKGILHKNPLTEVAGISAGESAREYLTIEEVRALVQTDCRYSVLK